MKKLKPKKPKLKQQVSANLARSTELLARVQRFVGSGKSLEDPEVQAVLQELAALVQDVRLSQELLARAIAKATVKR